ncbi:hypothetical protein S40288_08616 [Stachybotrys chartarum IBT 40288]|nr:hypothetical protein S40288_08616 [Stachybotrys chartarum IBT 40288]
MGSYTFKWDQPAEEVYVTGTFDGWTKSVKLDKIGDVFQKTVEVKAPEGASKIYYKYVVDNQWILNESAPKEADHEGNDNNYLSTSDLAAEPSHAILNNVTADSTTAKLAGEQPLENEAPPNEPLATPSDVPGGFPTTPANELDKPIGINPLPAADGAINPIKLEPGEKVPDSVTTQSVNDHVKLDKESYEKSDTLAGADLQLPPVINTTIPESSLPMGDIQNPTINSVGPESTTAALAGEVPLESKVPEVVKESQEKAGVDPEASAVPEEVAEKAKLESELMEKVPEAPATSEGTVGQTTTAAAQSAFATNVAPTINQTVAAATDVADKNLPDSVKQSLPASVQGALATETKEEKREEVSPEVPLEVKESIVEASESPEAAANTEAVQEKKAVEAELLKEVEPAAPVGESSAVTDNYITEPAKTEEKKEVVEPANPEQANSVAAPALTEATRAEETPKVEETPKTEEKSKVEETPTTETTSAVAPTSTEAKTETKTEEVKPAATETASAPANGSNGTSAPKPAAAATSKPADAASTTTERKKKHRVSAFFDKLKTKFSDKK